MSKKGGYLIIDLENINITAPAQTQKLDLSYNFYITANSSNDWVIECDNATSSQTFTLYYVGY